RPRDRSRLPALRRHRRRRQGDPPGRQDGHQGARAVLLLGHGADVAPGVGAVVESGRGRPAAVALPHLPDNLAPGAPGGFRSGPAGSHVYRGLRLPDGLINIIAALIGAGVLERHPRLRVSFGESGIGWLPYALDRMDFEYEDRFRDLMKMKPSEYWRRQCKATFQFDPIGTKLVDDIKVE